jgi:hypothetical protein
MSFIGTKVTTPMPNGLRWPAIAISDLKATPTTVVNKVTGQPVVIEVTRFKCISLRETKAGEKYLAISTEVNDYGYRPVAEPRFSTVVGLDATEDGEVITLAQIMEMHGKSYSEWASKNFEARRGATDAADL